MKNLIPLELHSIAINEGVMSEIDIMAQEARNVKEFIKEFMAEYGDKVKDNAETRKWLESMYNDVVNEKNKGLWANIHAKRKKGKKPARKGSEAYKKAKAAADKLNNESVDLDIDSLNSKELKEISVSIENFKLLSRNEQDLFLKNYSAILPSNMVSILKSYRVDEAFIGPFVFNDKMSDDELKDMYDAALDGYANYSKGFEHPKSKYKQAYQAIEKILKKRGVSVDESEKPRFKKRDRIEYRLTHQGGVGKYANAISQSDHVETGVIAKRTRTLAGFKYMLTTGLELSDHEILGLAESLNEKKAPFPYNLGYNGRNDHFKYAEEIGMAVKDIEGIRDYHKMAARGGKTAVQDLSSRILITTIGQPEIKDAIVKALKGVDDNIDLKTIKSNYDAPDRERSKHEQDNDMWKWEIQKKEDFHSYKRKYGNAPKQDREFTRDHQMEFIDMLAPYSTTQHQLADIDITSLEDFLQYAADHVSPANLKKVTKRIKKEYPKLESVQFNEGKKYKARELNNLWYGVYGEPLSNYSSFLSELEYNYRRGISKEEIADLWDKHYGEDMEQDYSGFYDKLEESVSEAKHSVIHKAAKKGNYPVTVIATRDGKVVRQETVTTPTQVPAVFNVVQFEERGQGGDVKVHIESRTGETLFTESVNEGKMPERYVGLDDIVYVKVKEDSRGANYKLYWRGHDVEVGGRRFANEKELKSFASDFILSNQVYNKLKYKKPQAIPESKHILTLESFLNEEKTKKTNKTKIKVGDLVNQIYPEDWSASVTTRDGQLKPKYDVEWANGLVLSVKGKNVEVNTWSGKIIELPIDQVEYNDKWNSEEPFARWSSYKEYKLQEVTPAKGRRKKVTYWDGEKIVRWPAGKLNMSHMIKVAGKELTTSALGASKAYEGDLDDFIDWYLEKKNISPNDFDNKKKEDIRKQLSTKYGIIIHPGVNPFYESVSETKNVLTLESFLNEALPTQEIDPDKFPDQWKKDKQFFRQGYKDGSNVDDTVETKPVKLPASQLKPSQDAVYLGKALGMAIGGVEGGSLDAIISSDNRILDGHHRWAATIFNNPKARVGGVQAQLKIGDLIPVLRQAGDALGNNRGLPPKGGDVNIFKATLQDVRDAVYNGKHMNPEFYNREQAVEWFERTGEQKIQNSLNILQRVGPPAGAPPRAEMPRVTPDQVKNVANKLAGGAIDVRKPYVGDPEVKNRGGLQNYLK